jgi:hypothetical protein
MIGIENKEKNTNFEEKIDVYKYINQNYIESDEDSDIVEIDYLDIRDIFEVENIKIEGLKTLKQIQQLSGKKLIIRNYPEKQELCDGLIAFEDIAPLDNDNNNKKMVELEKQQSLLDFI